MRRLLSITVVILTLALSCLAQSTSVTKISEIKLSDGRYLFKVRASYGGMFPLTPSLEFFVANVQSNINSVITSADYYVRAQSERYVDFDLVLPSGTHNVSGTSYYSPSGILTTAPSGMPYNTLILTVPFPDPSTTILTVNAPPPAMIVTAAGSKVKIKLSYSDDNLSNLKNVVDYFFEVSIVKNGITSKYKLLNSEELAIEDSDGGVSIIQARVVVNFGGSLGYTPWNTPQSVEVSPGTKLVVPYFAEVPNLWSTSLVMEFKKPGVPVTLYFTHYVRKVVGGYNTVVKEEFKIDTVSTSYPIVVEAKDITSDQYGLIEITSVGCEFTGVSFLRSPVTGVFDVTPMIDADRASYKSILSGQTVGYFIYSGRVINSNISAGYSISNVSDEPAQVTVVYNVGNGYSTGSFSEVVTVDKHSVNSFGYDAAYFKQKTGLKGDTLYVSVKLESSIPVIVTGTSYEGVKAIGIWSEN